MADIDFLEQMINSMEEAVLRLEKAAEAKKADDTNKLRTFIFDLHNQIDKALGEENV